MCEQDLALAVIFQAEKDANIHKDCYDQRMARNFLCAVNNPWRESLEYWAALAHLKADAIIDLSRKKWRPELLRRSQCQNK